MLKPVFDDVDQYPYEEGSIFLGKNGPDKAIGIETYRHLMTIAGTQSGKGATLIVQNLRRWPHNVFGNDPKGENVSASWEDRERMGQRVAALDPYRVANIPERLRVSFNPLADLDPEDPEVPSTIEALAEGSIIRHKADDAVWDNGGRAVVAGFMAFCVLAADPDQKHLPAVAEQMRKAHRDPTMYELMAEIEHPYLGGLIREAALIGISAAAQNRQSESYVRSALDQTKWLVTDRKLANCLTTSTVSLRDLKDGKLSFFVCLPFDKSVVRPELLKLLLQYAMTVMQRDLDASRAPTRCLFLLDEAYCMGRVPDLQRNLAGLTAYGVQTWTIWQNIAQIHELYKPEGSAQFFSAADVVMFFGMGEFDDSTARIVADAIGRAEVRDIEAKLPRKQLTDAPQDLWVNAYVTPVPPTPPQPTPMLTDCKGARAGAAVGDMLAQSSYLAATMQYQSDMREHGLAQLYLAMARELAEVRLHEETTAYGHAMSMRGDYKLPPREVRRLTAKAGPRLPSSKMIAFTGRGDVLLVDLLPHWEKQVRHPYTVQLERARNAVLERNVEHSKRREERLAMMKETSAAIERHLQLFGSDNRKLWPEFVVYIFEVALGAIAFAASIRFLDLEWQSGRPTESPEALLLYLLLVIVGLRGIVPCAVQLGGGVGEALASFIIRFRAERMRSMKVAQGHHRRSINTAEEGLGETHRRFYELDSDYRAVAHLTV